MHTFIIIKPDAVRRGLVGKIIARLEYYHMRIVRIDTKIKDRDWFDAHYSHLVLPIEKLDRIAAFMCGTPLIGIILKADVNIVRRLTLRFRDDFKAIGYCNLIHAADSQEAAEREIKLFFEE